MLLILARPPGVPGNANYGVSQPAPRATMLVQTNPALPANKVTNPFQPSPAHLINSPSAVRC